MITETVSTIKHCTICNELFEKPVKYSVSQWESRKSCSVECGRVLNGILRKGRQQTEESNLKRSVALKQAYKEGRHSVVHDEAMKEKISNGFSTEMREQIAESKRGEKNPCWKGGITPTNMVIRASAEYRLWRESVFLRDEYTCVWCGVRGGNLNADHIKPFAYFPELRFAIDNGRTLCVPCHKTTDTYGARKPKLQ